MTFLGSLPDRQSPQMRAEIAIYQGMEVTVTRAEWPAVRAHLLENVDEWMYLDKDAQARLTMTEVHRLDEFFADPTHDAATRCNQIVPRDF